MIPVTALLNVLKVLELVGDDQREIRHIAIDSRKVQAGGMFIAIRGTSLDGHKFIETAIENGATTILCEQIPANQPGDVTWIRVADSAQAAGVAAQVFAGEPGKHLTLIGVTGTNGKTTVVTLLHELMLRMGMKAGLISTVESRSVDRVIPATLTTPDPVSLAELLAMMVSDGCSHAFMEVSSHAMEQGRTSGLKFAGGVFTNLSHDHLDYHGDFQSYLNAKKKFFDGLDSSAFALINVDDPRGEIMVQNTAAKVSKYSLHKLADFKGKVLGSDINGLHLQLNGTEMMSRLVGGFNAYNLLAVFGTARLLGFEKEEVLTGLSALQPVAGRFDITRSAQRGISAIVDYAHTPDALQKVLETLDQLKPRGAQVIVVVGCGGDRDRTKRPKMGAIAAMIADRAILTSDNPRTEDPEAILQDMLAGVAGDKKKKVLKISDRREAIRTAVQLAASGDIILIAGKGHETYQEIHGKRFPFNDKDIVHEALFEDI